MIRADVGSDAMWADVERDAGSAAARWTDVLRDLLRARRAVNARDHARGMPLGLGHPHMVVAEIVRALIAALAVAASVALAPVAWWAPLAWIAPLALVLRLSPVVAHMVPPLRAVPLPQPVVVAVPAAVSWLAGWGVAHAALVAAAASVLWRVATRGLGGARVRAFPSEQLLSLPLGAAVVGHLEGTFDPGCTFVHVAEYADGVVLVDARSSDSWWGVIVVDARSCFVEVRWSDDFVDAVVARPAACAVLRRRHGRYWVWADGRSVPDRTRAATDLAFLCHDLERAERIGAAGPNGRAVADVLGLASGRRFEGAKAPGPAVAVLRVDVPRHREAALRLLLHAVVALAVLAAAQPLFGGAAWPMAALAFAGTQVDVRVLTWCRPRGAE